jgi:hypothetical protein
MKKAIKIVLSILLALILVVVCLDIWATHFRMPSAEEKGIWTSESPGARFRVTGYSTKSVFTKLISTMPGDGGSFGPGIVILWDNATGKILQTAEVENVSAHDYVKWRIGDPDAIWRKNLAMLNGLKDRWEGDYVDIMLVDTWPLPSEDGKMPLPWPKIKTYPSSN